MRLFNLVLWLSLSLWSTSQSLKKEDIVNHAAESHGALSVDEKPIAKIRLDIKFLPFYSEYYQELENRQLDTGILSEIITNLKFTDTTKWKDNEFTGLLVKSGYNRTNVHNSKVIRLSRPVFDNSKMFAIIQWDNGYSGLAGGGGISLYKLEQDVWSEQGTVTSWKY